MGKRVVAIVTAGLVTVSLGLSFSSTAGAVPEAKPADGLKLVKTKTSLLGEHYWYQQTFKGLPVVNGYYAKHVSKSGTIEVNDGRDAVPADLDVNAKVPSATATKSANAVVTARSARAQRGGPEKNLTPAPAAGDGAAQLAVIGGPNARLVWNVTSRSSLS